MIREVFAAAIYWANGSPAGSTAHDTQEEAEQALELRLTNLASQDLYGIVERRLAWVTA